MNERSDLTRITIDIPKSDHKRLKAMAALLGKSMRELVIESIEEHLKKDNYPNELTRKAISNVNNRKNLTEASDLKDLFKKLGI